MWRAVEIERYLSGQGTFDAEAFPGGLYPAAGSLPKAREEVRYHYVWVRDNVFVAYWLFEMGRVEEAVQTMQSLCRYFWAHKHRFLDIIDGRADPRNAMSRPHVRFEGGSLSEVGEEWSHKQNDALGYFLWFASDLLLADQHRLSAEVLSTIALFPRFFEAIAFWQDADSGHWEEYETVRASSIGIALAGLLALRRHLDKPSLAAAFAEHGVTFELMERLCSKGDRALAKILPHESIESGMERSVDAALLFLIFPTGIVDGCIAESILRGVRENLQRDIGIVRYEGDTYWARDFKEHVSLRERTSLLSRSSARNRINVQRGEEAQWCIFDSTLSTIHGRRFLKGNSDRDLDLQVEYLNRALDQLTRDSNGFPAYRCPEAYYLAGNAWRPNDATPLLWSQANLQIALRQANRTWQARI